MLPRVWVRALAVRCWAPNYRMSNVCAGIGRGQMTVLNQHIAHHKQPVYAGCDVYTNGVEEAIFKIDMCLPAGPYVTDDDVRYIVDCIKEAIEK